MSAPATVDDLIGLMRNSGLVEEPKIAAFQARHQHDGVLAGDPRQAVTVMIRERLITYFQAEQFLIGKWRGFTLGKYKLLERIGVGGVGQVFLCEHMFMRKRVAVKVLPPAKAEDPVTLARFYNEARVTSGLENPHIVRTIDIDQDGPHHFLVMEYVDGSTLLNIVRKTGPMDPIRACNYIKQAAQGLQYANRRGMIHRDIKPGNIIVDRQGVAKILDMGLARIYHDDQERLTIKYDDKNLLGTADYISPEQTRGNRDIDIRADLYGLGATFYFTLTGQAPFPDGTVADKLIAHQTRKPRPIREIRPDVPNGLVKIVDKLMAKQPGDRYQTPEEVVAALDPWTEAPVPPPTPEEMPSLSPAAMEINYAKPVLLSAALRDTPAPSRREEPPRPRPASSPGFAPLVPSEPMDLEQGHTVPVPKPVNLGRSSGEITLPQAALAGVPPIPSPAMRLEPSRPVASPAPETPPPPPFEAPRLGGSKATSPPLTPPTSETPSPAPKLNKPVSLADYVSSKRSGVVPLPPTQLPKGPTSGDFAPPPTKTPSLADFAPPAKTPDLPRLPEPPRPGLGRSAVPGLPRPASASRVIPPVDLPRPSALGVFRPTSPENSTINPDLLRPPAPPERPASGQLRPSSQATPSYKPPTLMPFFDQPIAGNEIGFFGRLMRWLLMIIISSLIGGLLGVGIWYFVLLKKPIPFISG